jgi:hypothetical protein
MNASDVKACYGAMFLDVNYTFNGQPAEQGIYEMHSGGSFTEFTFVGGVLTEFADLGRVPIDAIFERR